MKPYRLKVLSLFLILVMIIQSSSMISLAVDYSSKEGSIETNIIENEDSNELKITCEIIKKRTEYSKTFKMNDGSYCELNSSEPLHYNNGDKWEEINPLESETLTVKQFTSKFEEDRQLTKEKDSEQIRGGASHSSSFTSLYKCFTKQGSSFVETSTPVVKYNNSRILFKSLEPGLTIGNPRFILNAKLILNCTSINLGGDTSNYIAIKKAVQPWNENTTTYTFSGLGNKSYDNENIIATGVYDWDITEIYNLWETGEVPNYGVVLIEADSKTRNATAQFSLNPYFVINYREISPLDDDFPTYSFDMGRAGTVIVNEFTNNAVIMRDDLGIDGAALPVSLKSYIYNDNFTAVDQYGHNRSFNYNSILKYNNGVFEWFTVDGKIVEFSRDITYQSSSYSKWIDSSENYVLMVKMLAGDIIDWDYSDNYIECVDSITYYFDSGNGNWANLVRITDSNNKEINITYQDGMISKITDGAGREYRFTYNNITPESNNITLALSNISVYADGNSNSEIGFTAVNNQPIIIGVSYGYELSNSTGNVLLTSVTYQDGLSIAYTYDNDDEIESITNVDGSVFRISYSGGSIPDKIYAKYNNSESTSPMDVITIDDHIPYRREITNRFNEITEYFFNRLLKIQSYKKYILDNNGYEELIEAEQYEYNSDGSIKSLLSLESESTNTLLTNPDFEDEDDIANSEFGWYTEDEDENVIIDNKTDYSIPYDGGEFELTINGNIREEMSAYQVVDVSNDETYPNGTPIVISGWGKAGVNCVSAPEHFFGIKVFAVYQSQSNNPNVEYEVCSVPFETNIIDEWQYGISSFKLQRIKNGMEIIELKACCEFDYQRANSIAYFDNLKMFTTCDYYEAPEPSTCNCANCSYGVGCPCECASEAVCNCPECNGTSPQLCACGFDCHFGEGCQCDCASASVCDCVSCKSYTHVVTDSTNHTVRTVTTDGTKDMVFEKTFTSDDNYVTEEVDENGVEISYSYANSKNGLVTSSMNSYGTTTYAYDAMGRLAEIKTAVSGLSNGATHIKNEYSYQNDRISSITHNGFSYNFLYNDYGDYYVVKIGEQNLITYGYNNKQQVNSITYGNNYAFYYSYTGENITQVEDSQHHLIYQYDYDDEGNLVKIIDSVSGLTTELGATKLIDHATYFVGRKISDMNQANAAYIAETGDSTPANLPYSSNDFNTALPDELYCEEIVYRTNNPRDIRYARVVEGEGVYEYYAENEFYKYNTETNYNPVTGISVSSTKTDIGYNGNTLTTAYSQDCFGRIVNTEDIGGLIGASVYEDSSASKIVVEKDNRDLPYSINKTNNYFNDSPTIARPQILGMSGDISSIGNWHNADYFYARYHNIDAYWADYTGYSFEYDNSNRLIRAYCQGAYGGVDDVRYTYDNNSRIIREDNYKSYSSSHTYVFSYDENGKINERFDYEYTLGEPVTLLSSSLVVYDENSGTYYSTGNYNWHYTYEYSYVYDNNGNITHVYDGLDNSTRSLLARYSYDNAGQIIREDNSIDNKTYTYTYDAGGNIVQKNEYAYTLDNLGTLTNSVVYSYDTTWKDKLINYDGKQITYDNIGNPLTYSSANNNNEEFRTYEWDGKHLISCSVFNCNNNPNTNYKNEYYYDYEGNISRIITYDYNVSNGEYIIDYSDPRTTEFTWKDGKLVYQCVNPSDISATQPNDYAPYNYEQDAIITIRYLYDENDEVYGFITNRNRLFYYQKNLQGDITGIIQPSSQKCFLTYSYDAYGKLSYELHYSGITEMLAAMNLLGYNALAYRGYTFDYVTSMYYLHSRFYVPEWGRFLNADTYFDTGDSVIGTNVFAYCNNNPANGIDPTGEYNSALAKAYAQKWWNGYNPIYKKNPSDCANFVSQCLYEGKLSRMTGILNSGWHHWKIQIPVYSSNPLIGAYISGTKYIWQVSNAWGKASELKKWLEKSKYVSEVITITKVNDIKDKIKSLSTNHCTAVIFFKERSLTYYSHVAISGIVDKRNGNIYYYSHTSPRNGNEKSKTGIREVLSSPSYEKIQIYVLKP